MTQEQLQAALSAIQALVVQARFQAFEAGAGHVADLLDNIELLPQFVAENRTADFDEMMHGIVEKHPECRYILEQYAEHDVAVG